VKVRVPLELRPALAVVHPEAGETTRAGTAPLGRRPIMPLMFEPGT
jgi:hypothetical protein